MPRFQAWALRFLSVLPAWIVWLFARPYIAGPTLRDALVTADWLWREKGSYSTIDLLGEDPTRWDDIEAYEREVRKLIMCVGARPYVYVSIKLTALGLRTHPRECYELARGLVTMANAHGVLIRFDAEDSTTTDGMHNVYRLVRGAFLSNVGLVLQSRLFRTMDDLAKLLQAHGTTLDYRACIGIYNESAAVAHRDKSAMKSALLEMIRMGWEAGATVRVASHDANVVRAALAMAVELEVPADKLEFQWLLGVPDPGGAHALIRTAGASLRFYVPYGMNWRAYALRRFNENPDLLGYIVKNLLAKVFGR